MIVFTWTRCINNISIIIVHFFFTFLDWHTSEASLGWSYRYVQQMGQQCQALLWWRSCQTYGRVPGITWHHCAAVSNAGSWTTREESGKLHHNAPEWSRQGNEPLSKVSWLFPCWTKYLQSTCFLRPLRLKASKGLKRVQTDLNTGSKRRNTAFKLVL